MPKPKNNEIHDKFSVDEIRATIHVGLQNIGILSAFMTALAGQIYTNPPNELQCLGENALKILITFEWMAMGCFFFSMTSSVILALDLDGIPNVCLKEHLFSANLFYALPYLSTLIGIILMASGYGIDIGERLGCSFSYFGFIAAPLFIFSVISFGIGLRCLRMRLNKKVKLKNLNIGTSWFTTWADRISPIERVAPLFLKSGLERQNTKL